MLEKSATMIVAIGLLLAIQITIINGATTHHKHGGHSKERIEDGSYSPRDAHHHNEHGEHNVDFDHEAILGSVKEAEEFDQLSPEESKKRLAILVTKMDLNDDRFIDRHELKAWILRSFRQLSEEEAADRFEDIDENRDDQITWTEYIQETYGKDPIAADIVGDNEEDKLIADDLRMFEAADLNNDGLLNAEEFVAFLSPEEFAHMLPVILEQTLKNKDTDTNGLISFQEFIGDASTNHDKEWLLSEKEKFDTEYDLDKDGVLNGNEILSWVVPSNDEVASDEVDHLFASADDNHDDRLAYQEIVDNYDIFVGSEATDYGDHLQNIDHFNDEL